MKGLSEEPNDLAARLKVSVRKAVVATAKRLSHRAQGCRPRLPWETARNEFRNRNAVESQSPALSSAATLENQRASLSATATRLRPASDTFVHTKYDAFVRPTKFSPSAKRYSPGVELWAATALRLHRSMSDALNETTILISMRFNTHGRPAR
jgi:hypothetical protein